MTNAFLDTSALVNYYHPEDGTPEVTRVVEASGSLHYISRLSLVETVSAFAVKVRIGQIDEQAWNELRRRFYHDTGTGRATFPPTRSCQCRTKIAAFQSTVTGDI